MQKEITKKDNKTIYSIHFDNLNDVYSYIKSNPPINSKIFEEPVSLGASNDFHGESLEKAVEYLFGGYNEDELENFLSLNASFSESINREESGKSRLERSLYRGMPLASLVAMGVPDCRIQYVDDADSAVRNIYFNLGYLGQTEEEQIINRGLAILYIVQAIEEKGDLVNFKAFSLSSVGDEIVNIEIDIKKPGDLFLDVAKCYFPIVGKEFLRRILFRIMESLPVKNLDWGQGYGEPPTAAYIRQFYDVSENDIVIAEPSELGIAGFNIYDDTISMIEKLGIQDEFDIPKIKEIKINRNNRKSRY